jgi:hypothetical protein
MEAAYMPRTDSTATDRTLLLRLALIGAVLGILTGWRIGGPEEPASTQLQPKLALSVVQLEAHEHIEKPSALSDLDQDRPKGPGVPYHES